MVNGRYPFKSAWGFTNGKRSSNRLALLRNEVKQPKNEPTMWQNWFFGPDGIGFGVLRRWTGSSWITAQNIRVRWF